jgi:hypothetical protein
MNRKFGSESASLWAIFVRSSRARRKRPRQENYCRVADRKAAHGRERSKTESCGFVLAASDRLAEKAQPLRALALSEVPTIGIVRISTNTEPKRIVSFYAGDQNVS